MLYLEEVPHRVAETSSGHAVNLGPQPDRIDVVCLQQRAGRIDRPNGPSELGQVLRRDGGRIPALGVAAPGPAYESQNSPLRVLFGARDPGLKLTRFLWRGRRSGNDSADLLSGGTLLALVPIFPGDGVVIDDADRGGGEPASQGFIVRVQRIIS